MSSREKHERSMTEGSPAPQRHTLTLRAAGPPLLLLTNHDSHNPIVKTTSPEMHRLERKRRLERHHLIRRRSGSRAPADSLVRSVLLQAQALLGVRPFAQESEATAEIQIGALRVVRSG